MITPLFANLGNRAKRILKEKKNCKGEESASQYLIRILPKEDVLPVLYLKSSQVSFY